MTATPPSRRPVARALPPSPRAALLTILLFVGSLYLAESLDTATGGLLDRAGALYPRDLDGLTGILTAPLLHGGFAHLAANTVPLLVFGFLALSVGTGRWVAVTATVWLVSGVGVWLLSPAPVLGASGIVFGWFLFLLARGFYARHPGQVVLALVLFAIWGSLLWGVLPSSPMVSWQAHLFGALGGLLAASRVARADRARTAPSLGT